MFPLVHDYALRTRRQDGMKNTLKLDCSTLLIPFLRNDLAADEGIQPSAVSWVPNSAQGDQHIALDNQQYVEHEPVATEQPVIKI